MIRRWLRSLFVSGCCLLAAVTSGQAVEMDKAKSNTVNTPQLTNGTTSLELENTVQDIINRTNGFRQAQGLSEVKPNPQLMETARDFAKFMATTGKYGHIADGRSPVERARQHGYTLCFIAENIAYQHRTSDFTSAELARELFQGWKHSADHRKNILDPTAMEIGVAMRQPLETYPAEGRRYVCARIPHRCHVG
jgi:uncharacterized protein YkwD